MATYFDKCLYLYPTLSQVTYWNTQYDGTPWNDLYAGLIWENTEIAKPSKSELDALDDSIVELELARRAEVQRKALRDETYKSNLQVVQGYQTAKLASGALTFSEYLDSLESFINSPNNLS
jgi:hypothetical protein